MPEEGCAGEGGVGGGGARGGGWGCLKIAFFCGSIAIKQWMYCFVLRTGAIGSENQHVFADVINVSMASNYNGKI